MIKCLKTGKKEIKTELPAFIMGIVNCTPDSFYDKSRGGAEEALRLIGEGADILDIGGESTRPGSSYISAEEEINRVIPVIKEVRKVSDIPISVDTRKMAVMKAAVEAGADIFNDVSAMEDDDASAEYAAKEGLTVILMHKKGIPSTMQNNALSSGAFEEVDRYLKSRCDYALSKGISPDKIIVDPGIGFGKDLEANKELIVRCGELCGSKYPVLMALSRKTCIGQMTANGEENVRDVKDRLAGTLAANLVSVMKGASIVRVHDVRDCRDTFAVLKLLTNRSNR